MDINNITQKLKKKGYRNSINRDSIIEILEERNLPLSTDELIKELNSLGLHPNKTTVYRDIYVLLGENFINEVDLLDGKKRYEINRRHHHHFICTKCKDISCVETENDLNNLESKIEKEQGFKIKSHVLEFFGLCRKCKKD